MPPFQSSPVYVSGARVLVVDDDRRTVNKIWHALLDCRVMTETSVTSALRRLHAGERFDVLFCGLMMAEMSGAEFFLHVSRIDAEQAGRIVFLTGLGSLSDEFLAEHRALEQPFEAAEIRAVTANVVDDYARSA